MDFSSEEINFFSELFKPDKKPRANNDHVLTLQSSVPANIAHLFSNANLTLLAEVAHYQLWFPLHLKIDNEGIMTPTLNAPEVIDTKGTQRSWRWSELNIKSQGFKIESISNTGVFLKPLRKNKNLKKSQRMEFILPNKQSISMNIEPVRQSTQGIAAKITQIYTGQEQLRAFIFEEHKRQYAKLYENGQLVEKFS
ncbi:hypothetical protein P20652_2341 [Pseudoalteromonas sp. BSi20652]|uniref:hypothetical protein n=1 Tax=Pseudoalteromonas sp. BSi20652 TaxID=388384 RepID=UPI0002317B3E|nr:hypothetical protein [Pseudoalteromonas sp. BSi20652]GAA60475.1 hypothetical protein P20652_2341 [Pseudoalteromonas sp. BSi20652]